MGLLSENEDLFRNIHPIDLCKLKKEGAL